MAYEVVINRCYGGFSLSQEAIVLGIDIADGSGNFPEHWVWDSVCKYGRFDGRPRNPCRRGKALLLRSLCRYV